MLVMRLLDDGVRGFSYKLKTENRDRQHVDCPVLLGGGGQGADAKDVGEVSSFPCFGKGSALEI